MPALLAALLMALAPAAGACSYLTDDDVSRIRELWPDYAYAAKMTGVPVEVLPAIHYREANLRMGWFSARRQKVTRNVGGPFMLDLGPLNDHAEFCRRIRAHEMAVCRKYRFAWPAPRVSRNFRFAALVAADELKNKSRRGLRGEGLADAVWGYNGRAAWHHGNHLESAYVWNDPINGVVLTKRYKNAKGEMVQFEDTRPGVMVVYSEILELRRLGLLP